MSEIRIDVVTRIYEALGKLTANVENLTKAFESHREETTERHNKVHEIVVAMSESVRNLTRRIEVVEPVAKEFSEGQIEQRGIKRFLVAAYTAAGGIIVLVLGKLWDWYMARPHIPAIVIAVLALLALGSAAYPQHQHPVADMPLHDGFYSKWMMPSDRTRSCCNKQDCSPARAYFQNGKWMVWSKVRSAFIEVPKGAIEQEADVPMGAHLCENSSGILCFGVGNGT